MHMAQLMPLPLTVSCSNKIQIGFTFLVLAHLGSPGQRPLNVCVYFLSTHFWHLVHCNELLPTPLLQTPHGHLAAFCHTI